MQDFISKVLSEYLVEKRKDFVANDLASYVRKKPKEIIKNLLGKDLEGFIVKSSSGQRGTWATVPWIAIINPEITTTTQVGYYVVFLFSADMKKVYLSLNQGITELSQEFGIPKAKRQLRRNAEFIRDRVDEYKKYKFSTNPINLSSKLFRPSTYECGHAFGKIYLKSKIPNNEIIVQDIKAMLNLYNLLYRRGGLDIRRNFIDTDDYIPENLGQQNLIEQKKYRKHRTIERNPKLIKLVKKIRKYICELCGFDFKKEYKNVSLNKDGDPYIEAHHLTPLHTLKLGEKRKWDPKEDFRVLCSNCHRMVHKRNPPYTLEEMKKIMKEEKI
jgi:5-methylcytosine-specific restriction protein A|tara:strand:+ start:164 stop:1150 length:987 start_codon:yes stop_codon:yes gene_type:complete